MRARFKLEYKDFHDYIVLRDSCRAWTYIDAVLDIHGAVHSRYCLRNLLECPKVKLTDAFVAAPESLQWQHWPHNCAAREMADYLMHLIHEQGRRTDVC